MGWGGCGLGQAPLPLRSLSEQGGRSGRMSGGWDLDLSSKEGGGEKGGVGGLGVFVFGLARLIGFGLLVVGGGELAEVGMGIEWEGRLGRGCLS